MGPHLSEHIFIIIPVLVGLMFVFIFSSFIVIGIRNLITWNKNNHSPQLVVDAWVVTKTTDVSHHANNNMSHSSTSFYATFEVESGDRIEFALSRENYGMLAEGDQGKLTFQGSRYINFERN